MRIADRIQKMIDGMPAGGAVTLPVDSLREWLSEAGTTIEHDLTVDDVAKFFDRSPVTVRAWIRGGRLRAYRFQRREYRIPESALEEFQDRERNGGQ